MLYILPVGSPNFGVVLIVVFSPGLTPSDVVVPKNVNVHIDKNYITFKSMVY